MTRISRESESRKNEMRQEYEMFYASPLSLPQGVAKEGFSYHWASRSTRGEENYEVERLAREGWTLVPADRAPDRCSDPLKRNPLAEQYICHKDVILMERPTILSERKTAALHALNENRIRSLRGVSNDIGSFGRPQSAINSF